MESLKGKSPIELLENALFTERKREGKVLKYERSSTLFPQNPDYSKSDNMKFIAHLIQIDDNGKCTAVALGKETEGAGGSPENHPDQTFWGERDKRDHKLVPRKIKATSGRVIVVTDCKELPCDDAKFSSCQFQIPKIVKDATGLDGIPIWVFAHRGFRTDVEGGQLVYQTFSGAKWDDINAHITKTLGTWAWSKKQG